VDRVAREHNVSLRTGCFCNPGAGEVAFTISRETLVGGEFGEGMMLDDYVRAIGLPSGGAIRASLGLASNFADVHRFMRFAAEFIDLGDVPDDLPPRTTCEAPRVSQSASTADMPLSPTSIICQPSPAWKGSPAWKRIGTVAPSIFLPSRQVVPVPTL
jgi:hypothetical protein